ncbi:carbohydrate sulfotransferase 1-like [Liolophura sinensis]|uniref:carbohydrate sulfotransferase 1-like n=1 Tax=Liolophura sinensis TaxID=3198878 RepID=UPI0031596FF6
MNMGPKIRIRFSQNSSEEFQRHHPGSLVAMESRHRAEVQRETGRAQNATGSVGRPDINLGATNDVIGSGLKQAKVLILAYYRSGSTLTGSFFNSLPGVFYTFEPLHAVFKNADRQRSLKYFSGKVRTAPKWEEISNLSLEILQAFYSCDLEALDWHTITSGFGAKSTAYAEYIGCLRSTPLNSNNRENVRRNCLPGLIQRCKSSKTIVVKTIRVHMTLAEELLKVIPDLKIVHLMRDPRGMACSLQRKQCRGSLANVNDMCARLTTDVLRRRALAHVHPESVCSVKYEDIIQTPLRTVMNMFKFLGLVFHSDVAKWIFYTLFSGHQSNGPLSITKSNSIATAYNWTRRIHWDVVDRYQQTCADFLREEHYPVFYDIVDVRKFRVTERNLTEQVLELQQFWSQKDGGDLAV